MVSKSEEDMVSLEVSAAVALLSESGVMSAVRVLLKQLSRIQLDTIRGEIEKESDRLWMEAVRDYLTSINYKFPGIPTDVDSEMVVQETEHYDIGDADEDGHTDSVMITTYRRSEIVEVCAPDGSRLGFRRLDKDKLDGDIEDKIFPK